MAGTQGDIRSFIQPLPGPGKTAPSFIEDLTLFDILNPPVNGLNLLKDSPISYANNYTISEYLPAGNCRHKFCSKPSQSSLPPLDARPAAGVVYKVRATCRLCRTHIQLDVDYTERWRSDPCPNSTHPLHHLVYSPGREDKDNSEQSQGESDLTGGAGLFECSSTTCSAVVSVQVKPPWLSPEYVRLLTDKTLISQRTDKAIELKPSHLEGMPHPSPVEVLKDLRTYLRNVLDEKSKPIALYNKRFMLRFGPDGLACKDMFEFLGFTYKPKESWESPLRNIHDTRPFQDPVNIFLDDIEQELSILIVQRPEEERQLAQERTILSDALRDFSRALGSQDYDKMTTSRTIKIDPALRAPSYTALGIPSDAHDFLVRFAYHRQCHTDRRNSPIYLTYLQQIAEERDSEFLQIEVATERSAGKFDYEQRIRAYDYFGFSAANPPASDEPIIGNFLSRLQDAPMQETEMREYLRIIATDRESSKILEAAEDALNTYEQALAFLGGEATLSDDFIPSMFAMKIADDPTTKDKAFKAVRLIADARDSKALHRWLETGTLGEMDMDIGEAYRHLNIDDRTIDDDFILTAYNMAVTDNPASAETYTKAINSIATDRQSSLIQQALRGGNTTTDEGAADWPVGLENIGNTCYLNSLLQFFFTIKELRDLVLKFDDVKMDLKKESVDGKKVGSRHISLQEVERAQKFVWSLRTLFQEMINSSHTTVTPKQDLARLTLMTSTAEEKFRRKSNIGAGGRPSLGHIDGEPVIGPLGPPTSTMNEVLAGEAVQSPSSVDASHAFQLPSPIQNGEILESPNEDNPNSTDLEMEISGDNSSEVTLISRPSFEDSVMVDVGAKDQQQQIIDNKENKPPFREDSRRTEVRSSENSTGVLGESSPSKLNAQAGAGATPGDSADSKNETADRSHAAPPSRPPPIPPRPVPQDPTPILEEYARQQDVTEVIGHVLFQLACAIRPTAIDKDGEQLDQIQDLFFGKTNSHVIPEDSTPVTEKFSSIITRLASRPHDIYAALDGYFDMEEIEGGSNRYLSISSLPPIFQVHFDRVGFDQATKTYRKINHHVELKETIYLDRYMEDAIDSDIMVRRQQTWRWKKELAKLEARRMELSETATHPDVVKSFDDARNIMMSLQALSSREDQDDLKVSPSTIGTLESLAEETRAELEDLSQKSHDLSKMADTNFTDMRTHEYRLHAAFFHRGTQGSGHYWIYIYDFRKEMWRKYNDGYVTEVKDTTEIFRAPTAEELSTWSGPPNPYFLVYVRDDVRNQLAESVCRDIIIPHESQSRSTIADQTEYLEMADQAALRDNSNREISASIPQLDDADCKIFPSSVTAQVEHVGWDNSETNMDVKW